MRLLQAGKLVARKGWFDKNGGCYDLYLQLEGSREIVALNPHKPRKSAMEPARWYTAGIDILCEDWEEVEIQTVVLVQPVNRLPTPGSQTCAPQGFEAFDK